MIANLNLKFSDRQKIALFATDPIVLYGGAKGGGKSFLLCRWAFLMCAQHRGNKGFLGRKRSVDFSNTTLETWKKAIPIELYRINEQKKKIYLPFCAGVIDYGGLDDPKAVEKFNSAEYGFIGVDQSEEIVKDEFSMLRATLRHKLSDGSEPPYKILLTANPAECWLKSEFILNPQAGNRFIQSLPSDNPFLPKSYEETLRESFKHRDELLRAYLYGSWDDLAGNDTVIKTKWIEQCVRRPLTRINTKRIVACDPARFGDDETIIYAFENESIIDTETLNQKSTMETAGHCVVMKKKYNATLIAIDVCGLGAGIYDRLSELKECPYSVDSQAKAFDENKFVNLRAEMWWYAGEKFATGNCSIPDDPILKGQLGSPRYEITSDGRIKIESKEAIKERLGRSPDRADAFVYGLYALQSAGFCEGKDANKWRTSYKDKDRKPSVWAA